MTRLRSISSRLILIYFIIAVFTFVALVCSFSIGLKTKCVDNAQKKLALAQKAIVNTYTKVYDSTSSGADLEAALKQVAGFQSLRIWIFDNYGTKWFDISGSGSGLKEEDSIINENLLALEGEITSAQTGYAVSAEDDFFSTPIITYTAPLKGESGITGHMVLSVKVREYSTAMRTFFTQTLYILPLILLLAFALIFAAARGINKPLKSINAATKELAQGNFHMRAETSGLSDVGGIIESFNYMAEELEKYETTRESFVGNVSHELKSPLTSIQGFVQGILDGTIDSKEAPQYLEIVLMETKRMNTLISDLLDLAKYESGQFPMNYTRWDINELLRQCFIKFITKIEDKKLDVVVNIPEEKQMVTADKDRITQVLTNLIDNAVKFCNVGGEFKIWTHKTEEGVVQISISNTGSVIPEEDIPFVFDRFFKVDKSHNRKTGGTGIGLSIVRTIIQQHGQRIWVSSKRGAGTVFTFTLEDKPRKKTTAAQK